MDEFAVMMHLHVYVCAYETVWEKKSVLFAFGSQITDHYVYWNLANSFTLHRKLRSLHYTVDKQLF